MFKAERSTFDGQLETEISGWPRVWPMVPKKQRIKEAKKN
jgi:hypothetical protein